MPISRAGSIDQQRATLESPPPPPHPPPPISTYLPPQPPVTQCKYNNNHQNRHHELAPQQEEYLGQGWAEIRQKKSLSCSGSNSRSLGCGSRRTTPASGRLPSRTTSHVKSSRTYNRADPAAAGRNKKYIFTVPFSRGKNIYRPDPSKKNRTTVPSRRGENIYRTVPPREKTFLPSRPAEEKHIYRPVPPRKKMIAVQSRRTNK